MLVLTALLTVHVSLAGSLPSAPENITVTFLNPTSVRVSWQTSVDSHLTPVEKFDVTYKPTDARVVAVVAGNSEALVLEGLQPDTQYQLTIAALWGGKKYRSRPIVFRTLEPPRTSPQQDSGLVGNSNFPHSDGSNVHNFPDEYLDYHNSTNRELPTIRGVEIGIVVLVLMVWAGAIALFFNRWGKIRMLLPYQPDYKQEQLKVPGTGVCNSSTCNGQHSHQHFHHWPDEPSTAIAERCTRNRINSAIFVSSEGKGFDSIEFLRRYGSQSVLCRKAKSAENINSPERLSTLGQMTKAALNLSSIIVMQNCAQASFQMNNNAKFPTRNFDQYHNFETIELTEKSNDEIIEEIIEVPITITTTNSTTTTGSSSITTTATISTTATSSSTLVDINDNSKKKLSPLPTLSISSPSPPHQEEFL